MVQLIAFVSFALGVSFLCSLLEAALLSARLATLSELARHGSKGAGLLLSIKRTRVDDAISAILILNTISNTLGATMAGAQASIVFGSARVGLFSGVLTLMILVFSEIIPKTLGASYARTLAPYVGWTLQGLTRALRPVLFVSRSLTRWLTGGQSSTLSRGELSAVIAAASRDGAISDDESTIFANLLRVDEIRVEDVMTPRTVAFMMPEVASIGSLLAERACQNFSRVPVYRESPDDVVGYVLLREILQAIADGSADRTAPLSRFAREIQFVSELSSVGQALRLFLERRDPIAAVTDEHGGLSGLVTLEDLTETVLGTEILDESDRVADLRQAAIEARDRRLERLRDSRQPDAATNDED